MPRNPNTSEYLAEELEKVNAPKFLIANARANCYHDFKSHFAMPEHQLVHDLTRVGLKDFAQRVIKGEFGATKQEADEWAKSADGQATFKELTDSIKKRKRQ